MAQQKTVSNVDTLIDLRIAMETDQVLHVKVVRREISEAGPRDGEIDYAFFLDDEYMSSFDAVCHHWAIVGGMEKIFHMIRQSVEAFEMGTEGEQ